MRPPGIGILAVAFLAAAAPARAETLRYSLEVPGGDSASFEVPFEVAFPGTLEVRATWDGPRILSFRVEGPGAAVCVPRLEPAIPQVLPIHFAAVGVVVHDEHAAWVHEVPGAATGRRGYLCTTAADRAAAATGSTTSGMC